MTDNSPTGQVIGQNRLRLEYLDGLRGLAALYVVLYHASHWTTGTYSKPFVIVQKVLAYGHFAVAVFIILSGYCLMLPVARSKDGKLRGGFRDYIWRRARRLLPPYYASLLFSIAVIILVPGLNQLQCNYWDGALPAFGTGTILSHLLLIHNLLDSWNWKIDPPLWSVATEWQIYFFFPLVLLPLWRRFGLVAAVVTGLLLGYLPHFLLPFPYNIEPAAPWYLGLFALGMAGAVINFSSDSQATRIRMSVPWSFVATLLILTSVFLGTIRAHWWWDHLWFSDTMVGLSTVSLLIYCTERGRGDILPPVVAVLESRWPILLGTMSYSLYLFHAPLLALIYTLLKPIHLLPTIEMVTFLLVGIPLVIGCAYVFHRLFERPFMSYAAVRTSKA